MHLQRVLRFVLEEANRNLSDGLFNPEKERPVFSGGYTVIADSISSPLLQIELGTACGKLFRCSTMAILDAGDSDILSEQTQ